MRQNGRPRCCNNRKLFVKHTTNRMAFLEFCGWRAGWDSNASMRGCDGIVQIVFPAPFWIYCGRYGGSSGNSGSTTSQIEQANGKQRAQLPGKLYTAYLSSHFLCFSFDIISIEWDVIMSLNSKSSLSSPPLILRERKMTKQLWCLYQDPFWAIDGLLWIR